MHQLTLLSSVLILALFLTSSCTTVQCGANKSQFIEQYEKFMTEVESSDMSITDKQWSIYDEQFSVYILRCYESYKEDMSLSDKQEVLLGALQYYYIRYGSHMIREIQNEENAVSTQLRAEFDEIFDNPNAIIREIIGEEWDDLIDEFLDDLDKWQRKLEQLLEEEN